MVEAGGRRRFIEVPGANDHVSVAEGETRAGLAPGAIVLVSAALPETAVLAAARAGRQAGAVVAVDAAGVATTVRAALAYADIVHADSTEAEGVTGIAVADFETAFRAAQALRDLGPSTVAVQAGGEGNLVVDDRHEIREPLLDTQLVDPTGGGDAFLSALLVCRARGESLARSARIASATAAHTVGVLGGSPRFDEPALLAMID